MNLKTLILFVICSSLFVSCKRKKSEIQPEGKLANYPAHCYNGLLDSDETGVDCGGSCGSCNVAAPTCTQSTNKLSLGSSNYTITGVTFGNITSSSNYDFKGNYPGGTITITLAGSSPDVSQAYTIVTSTSPNYGEAYVSINSGSYGNMTSTTGKVYVNQTGGKYYAIVCGASFHSFVTSQNYATVLNIQCP